MPGTAINSHHNKSSNFFQVSCMKSDKMTNESLSKDCNNNTNPNSNTISCTKSERNDVMSNGTINSRDLRKSDDNENAKHFSATYLKEFLILQINSENSTTSYISDKYKKEINVIDDLITEIIKVSQNNSLGDIENMLDKLLEESSKEYVALHLVKCNLLQNVMDALDGEPRWIKMVLRIVFVVCFHDQANELVSNDKNFANKILSHLNFYDTSILLELFKLLEFRIIRKIEQNPRSSWVSRIKEYGFFEHCVIVILNFSTDMLLDVTIRLLRSISQINLIDRSNFLENLFNIYRLFPTLLTSYVRMIPERNSHYSEKELQFIDDWLAVITSIITRGFVFKNSENNENYIKLLKIIGNILQPYQLPNILTPDVETERNYYVIFKCMKLLSNFHLTLSVPLTIDRILMNISFRLKTALDSGGKNIESKRLLESVLNKLHEYWLNIVEHNSSLQILEIIYPCESDVRKYLINVGYSKCPDITREKIRIIDASFKETVFFNY